MQKEIQQESNINLHQPVPATPAPGLVIEPQDNAEEISESVINNPELPDTLTIEPGMDESGMDSTADDGLDKLPTAEDTVYFKLNRDSWIEVYDSGHNALYKQLAKSGDELTLSGIGPFSILLGYAPGVEVKFNGESFDPGPYTNAGIARFMLDSQENPD